MADITTINNGDSGLTVLTALNTNFENINEVITITTESVTRTIYVSTTGNDTTGDGTTELTAFATITRALEDIGDILEATITIQLGSGSFYLEPTDMLKIVDIQTVQAVDLIILGNTTTLTTLSGISQDSTNPFKYTVTNTLTVDELKGAFLNGTYGYYPIHSNGTDYFICSHAEGIINTEVIGNNTTLIFNDTNHIIFNFINYYSTGGFVIQNVNLQPGNVNRSLRLSAMNLLSKFKLYGCKITARNIKLENVLADYCYFEVSNRGVVLSEYNLTLQNCVFVGPGSGSGTACFDLQDASITLDNMIVDGFESVFENSSGTGSVYFGDDTGDLYIMNCTKIFSAYDNFKFGSGRLNKLVIDSVNYGYEISSDVDINLVLDSTKLVGTFTTGYILNDNGIKFNPSKCYIAYVDGVDDVVMQLNALNTVPASASDTGTTGEIKFSSDGVYICIATNTWIKCTGTTF